jgi:hypothetical protein
MRRYSIFHPLILSFFSKSLYIDVGKRWRGTGLLYLFMVVALVWIPTVIRGQVNISRWVDGDSKEITKQVPAIDVANGQVSTDVPTPYFIKDPKTGNDLAIIDTTGKYETLDNTDAALLLTKSSLTVKRSALENRTYDISGLQSFHLDRSSVEGWLITIKRWFIPVVYPLGVLVSFILRGIQMLIYALVGLLFAHLLHAKLEFQALMRLAAVAITPVLILNLVFEFVGFRVPGWILLGVVIALAYLFFAVKVNAEPDEAPPYQPPTEYPAAIA